MKDLLEPETVAGGYRVERLLGQGGMGAVYAAIHPVIGKRAALKVIHARVVATAPDPEVFVEEARIVNQIGHPNIIDIFGFESLPDGRPVLAMELLDGETLREMLARIGRLPVKDAVSLLLPILSGLQAAHDAGVLHRDLKPENIFLVRTVDEKVIPKLLDFGMARLLEAASGGSFVSGTGTPAGTPAYMSPEQCRGAALDVRSDVYALGLILFELVAGRGPFPGGSPAEYLGQHLYAPPARLSDVAHVDSRLDDLVGRLLSKDPAGRPPSVQALADALCEIVPAVSRTAGGLALTATLQVDRSQRDEAGPAPTSAGFLSTPGSGPHALLGAGMEENRLCTVLFADLSGFTALSEQLVPEEAKEIIDRCFSHLTAAVERHGGRVDKYIGDCVMAVFGVPRSRDDDAERAVRAALEMQRAIGKMGSGRRRPGVTQVELKLRIGLNTGPVFAGTVGSGQRREFTVMGDAVNVAARIQGAAPPASVVIGAETHHHVRKRFALEALPPLQAKGKSEPVPWYLVLGDVKEPVDDAAESSFYGVPSPMVGREDVLSAMAAHLEACTRESSARLVTVVAPPGLGKSRLFRELTTRLGARDDVWLEVCQPSPRAAANPFDLLVGVLRRRLGLDSDADADAVEAGMQRGLALLRQVSGLSDDDGNGSPSRVEGPVLEAMRRAHLPSHPEDVEDRLRDLVALLPTDGTGPRSNVTGLGDRVSAALAMVARLLTTRRPLVLMCDGLEQADEASLDVLEQVAIHLVDAPLLLIGFARPELLERRPAFGREGHRIDLPPLSAEDMETLVRTLLARVPDLSERVVRALVERSEGTPLILLEILRTLIDAGFIRRENDRWRVDGSRFETLALPSTIHGIVQARLDRLPAEERMLLMRAAVIGRQFWEGALTETLGGGGAAGAHVRVLLQRLESRDLLRRDGTELFPGEVTWSFVDGVVQEVAYGAMAQGPRADQHRAVARWLEHHGEAVVREHPALLARHHDGGGVPAEAFRYYVRAGRRDQDLGRNEEALSHYRRAREIVESAKGLLMQADADDRKGLESLRVAEWTDRVQLRLDLGNVLMRLGRMDEAEAAFQQGAREILREERREGHTLDLAQVSHFDGLVELHLGLVEKTRGNHDEALACFQAAVDRVGSDGDPALRMHIGAEIGWVLSKAGDDAGSIATSFEALRLGRRIDRDDPEARACMARLLHTIGSVLYGRKQLVRAERIFKTALRTSEAGGQLHLASIALNNLAAIDFARGDMVGAAELIRRSLAIKERLGGLYDIAVAHNNLAEVELALDHADRALEHGARSVRVFESLQATDVLPDAYRNQAAALLACGRPAEALGVAERALDLAQRPGSGAFLGPVGVTYARCYAAAARSGEETEAVARARKRAQHHLVPILEEAGLHDEAQTCRDLTA